MLASFGDIVGMTCAHEADLMRELSVPYALICMVDNLANGLDDSNLRVGDFYSGVQRNVGTMEDVLNVVLRGMLSSSSSASSGPSPSAGPGK